MSSPLLHMTSALGYLSKSKTFNVSLRLTTSPRTYTSPYSTHPPKPSVSSLSHDNPNLLSFNLFREVRHARPAVRYTVYAGLGLMATVESTFWLSVIRAKFFPSSSEEDKARDDEFFANAWSALESGRAAWMGNYGRYYGGYVWGVGER
jgi:hypothetical protein